MRGVRLGVRVTAVLCGRAEQFLTTEAQRTRRLRIHGAHFDSAAARQARRTRARAEVVRKSTGAVMRACSALPPRRRRVAPASVPDGGPKDRRRAKRAATSSTLSACIFSSNDEGAIRCDGSEATSRTARASRAVGAPRRHPARRPGLQAFVSRRHRCRTHGVGADASEMLAIAEGIGRPRRDGDG